MLCLICLICTYIHPFSARSPRTNTNNVRTTYAQPANIGLWQPARVDSNSNKNNILKNYNCTYQVSNIFDRIVFPRIILNKEIHKLNSKTFIPCTLGKLRYTRILVFLLLPISDFLTNRVYTYSANCTHTLTGICMTISDTVNTVTSKSVMLDNVQIYLYPCPYLRTYVHICVVAANLENLNINPCKTKYLYSERTYTYTYNCRLNPFRTRIGNCMLNPFTPNLSSTVQISTLFGRKAFPRKTKNKESQTLNSKTFILCLFGILILVTLSTHARIYTYSVNYMPLTANNGPWQLGQTNLGSLNINPCKLKYIYTKNITETVPFLRSQYLGETKWNHISYIILTLYHSFLYFALKSFGFRLYISNHTPVKRATSLILVSASLYLSAPDSIYCNLAKLVYLSAFMPNSPTDYLTRLYPI